MGVVVLISTLIYVIITKNNNLIEKVIYINYKNKKE